MPTLLPPVLTTAPFVEPQTGRLTRTAVGWLQSSYERQGGQEAASNTELAGGVAANTDYITKVEEDLGSTNTTLASLDAEVTALQQAFLQLTQEVEALTTRVTTLEGTVSTQGTRLAALEAWRTALVAALPAAVSVTAVPTLTDAPATADALRDNLTSAWQGNLNTNDAGLATGVNAIRTALAA
jgi:septal ring factor EnvC (AmiA/AmiB activator)